MIIGHGTHGLDLDVTNSVLRLSPRVSHGGVRNWTGAGGKAPEIRLLHGRPTETQPPGHHHVVSAWGGGGLNTRPMQVAAAERNDGTSNAYGKSVAEQPLLLPRRSHHMQRTTNVDQRLFGRNVKLVYLKDSTQFGSAFVR